MSYLTRERLDGLSAITEQGPHTSENCCECFSCFRPYFGFHSAVLEYATFSIPYEDRQSSTVDRNDDPTPRNIANKICEFVNNKDGKFYKKTSGNFLARTWEESTFRSEYNDP